MTPESFLLALAAHPYRQGENDCARACAAWIKERTGVDVFAAYGRSYNAADAAKWLAEPGGLPIAMRKVLRTCGFAQTKKPRIGDIGVLANEAMAFAAIRGGTSWLWLSPSGGLGSVDAGLVTPRFAWRLP